ncbi:hypothetical protein [Nonomuraea sp. B19D2]
MSMHELEFDEDDNHIVVRFTADLRPPTPVAGEGLRAMLDNPDDFV